jgi:tetratricopeptide (TPR) repeat protein
MAYLPAQRLKVYRNFKAIDAADYYGIIRYFEQHEEALGELDEEEYFDCAYTYAQALFEVGYYNQAVVMFDHLLEKVIVQNIAMWEGKDVFVHLLARKATALMRQQQWARAEHVVREGVKLNPEDPYWRQLLNKCLLRQRPHRLRQAWALCMGLLFASLLAVALELFVVRPFFPTYAPLLLFSHQLLLGAALAIALGSEGWHWYACRRKIRTFVQDIRARHRAKRP